MATRRSCANFCASTASVFPRAEAIARLTESGVELAGPPEVVEVHNIIKR